MTELISLFLSILGAIVYLKWKIKQIKKKKVKREVDIGLGYLRAAYNRKRL